MKILIVGGVAGGASAATRIRRRNEKAEIIMFERGEYISYANCGLPYYIGGEITEKSALTVQTPTAFQKRFNVDVRIKHEVLNIDTQNKKVTVLDIVNDITYTETYNKLILSPGATPFIPPIEGINNERVFTLRTVPDTFKIRDFVTENKPKHALIIGGGPIGLEVTEAFINNGIKVTLVDAANHVITPIDYDTAVTVHAYLKSKGVDLRLERFVKHIEDKDSRLSVHLNDDVIETDLVLLSAGVKPDTAFIKDSSIALDERGAIIVNAQMETNIPDVYALGDAVSTKNPITHQQQNVALAGPANKQASVLANVIVGKSDAYKGTIGTGIVRIFDLTVAMTGLNETAAKAANIDYDKVYLTTISHAGYYPGAKPLSLKVLFEKNTGKIVGGQVVGFEGADKRCDTISTAIYGGLTGEDLAMVDFAYAPPYTSVKDPVNMVGSIITTITDGLIEQYHWHDIETLLQQDVTFLDVREPIETANGHIEGAVKIPLGDLRKRMNELDKSKPIYICCHSGARSYNACRLLSQNGFKCKNLAGGYSLYSAIKNETSVLG